VSRSYRYGYDEEVITPEKIKTYKNTKAKLLKKQRVKKLKTRVKDHWRTHSISQHITTLSF
jgi:hypothetical protein